MPAPHGHEARDHAQRHRNEARAGKIAYRSLGEISTAQWERVAERFALGRVQQATPFAGGFGNNVELECDTGLWVFSGRLSREDAKREQFFIEQIADTSPVSIPWPYHIDASGEIFDWTYAVMRHIGGEFITWDQARNWDAVAHALGHGAAGLHARTFPTPAQWQEGRLVAFDGTQQERFEALVAEFVTKASRGGLLDEESELWVSEAVTAAKIEGYIPTLVHHDLTRNNTHFAFGREAVEVSGFFDFKECFIADPDEDLARSLWEFCVEAGPSPAQTFLEAYRAARPARGVKLRGCGRMSSMIFC